MPTSAIVLSLGGSLARDPDSEAHDAAADIRPHAPALLAAHLGDPPPALGFEQQVPAPRLGMNFHHRSNHRRAPLGCSDSVAGRGPHRPSRDPRVDARRGARYRILGQAWSGIPASHSPCTKGQRPADPGAGGTKREPGAGAPGRRSRGATEETRG